MFRDRRFAKAILTLIAVAGVALAVAGCAFLKPGSLSVSQPAGIGSARVHFNLCTIGDEFTCTPNDDDATVQYLAGVAVPPGSTPPASFNAVPVAGGPTVTFTRNDEVAAQMAASSTALQKLGGEITDPKEKEEFQAAQQLLGTAWPPSGLQGVGYLSGPVQETKGQKVEWSVDADFGLPVAADGAPFSGPFATAIAFGVRFVSGTQPASRPVSCVKFEPEVEPNDGDAFCAGTLQQAQFGTADLRIATPKTPGQAFVGGSAELAFPLMFAGTGTTVPTFALSATTTAKGGKAEVASASYTPGAPDPGTHQAPTTTGKVTVSVPRGIKPGEYQVTLTAATPQGGTATQVGTFKVTKPKLKLGGVQRNLTKGIATLKVKVPSGGLLTIAGKGVVKAKKKAPKAKTLKLRVASTGSASADLAKSGSTTLRAKVTFKPTSGISITKSKSIVLRLR